MQDFKELKVWRKAHELALGVYKATKEFPATEIYGLTSQMRRASISIPSNIAEGCGRGGNTEFARFLQISLGSAAELEYHLLLSRDLGFLSQPGFGLLEDDVVGVKRMLTALRQKVLSKKN